MTSPSPSWEIVEYRGREGLVRLEADWRRLHAAMPQRTGFHAYEAQLGYVDHLMAAPDDLRCLALRDAKQVRGICLLEHRVDRTLGLPVRVARVSLPSHLPWGDVICPEDDARRAFIPALVRHLRRDPRGIRLLILGPLPQASVLWEGLRSLDAREWCTDGAGSSNMFDCSRSFDSLLSQVSKKFRSTLRNRHRRLDALSDVRFLSVRDEPGLSSEFETFLDIEASGWKGAGGTRTAIRCSAAQQAFFRSLLAVHGDEDYCEIHTLYAEGRCIAAELCMRAGQDYAGLRMGYDERYSGLSPSHLLMEHVLQRCCSDAGVRRFNLVSDSAWQASWRPESIPLGRAYLAIGPCSGRPLVALLSLRFGPVRCLSRWGRREVERRREQWAERRGTGAPIAPGAREAAR